MNTTPTNKRVLFVCLGNICRSPAAEGIFRRLVNERGLQDMFLIDSAGTAGYHIGALPDKRMRHHGHLRGYDFNSKARQFDIEDFLNFDYIITMDDSNYRNVIQLAPDLSARTQVYRMMDFASKQTYDYVPDPYYEGADGFELVLDLLEDASQGLLDKIMRDVNEK